MPCFRQTHQGPHLTLKVLFSFELYLFPAFYIDTTQFSD